MANPDWTWLADTYWMVLAPDLPALNFSPRGDALSWVVDQTVWHISGTRDGYLWGVASVLMTDPGDAPSGRRARPQHLSLLGTVTPSAQVQLTFIPSDVPADATTGLGRLVHQTDGWGFEMQMSTDRLRARVLHYATMVQTRPGEPAWDALPGIGLSVPQMLEGAVYPTFPAS